MLREALRKLSKHTLTYAVAEQVSRLAGFLLIPLYTGKLSTSDYGTRELLAVTLALLAQIAGINLTAAMSRTYFESADPAHRRRVVGTALLSVGASGVLVAALLALASPWIVELLPSQHPAARRLFLLALAILVFQMIRETQNKVLQVEERSLLFGVFSVSKLVVEILLQIVFLVKLERGLEGLFEAVLLSEILFCTLIAFATLPRVDLRFSRPVFLSLWAFALPLVPNGILQFVLHQADRYLLGWIRGDEAVGLYGLAYKLGYLPNYLVLGPFLLIWYPYVFSLGSEEKQRELCSRLSPHLMLLMTAVSMVVALFASELVHVLAGQASYFPAWQAIPWVALGYWFWALFQIVQTGFYVQKKTRGLPRLTGVAALLNVLLNLALIPYLGFIGAAISTTLSFALLTWITARAIQPIFPLAIEWRRVFVPLAAAGLAVGVALWAARSFEAWHWAIKAGALIAWSWWAWRGGFYRTDERAAIAGAWVAATARWRKA